MPRRPTRGRYTRSIPWRLWTGGCGNTVVVRSRSCRAGLGRPRVNLGDVLLVSAATRGVPAMSADQLQPTRTSVQPDTITVDTGRVGDVTVVHVAGVVDMTTVPIVKAELTRAAIGDTTAVVVDLNSVSFLACSGLRI